MMQERIFDTTSTTAASYITSGGTLILGGLTLSEWGVIIAAATAIGTFAINWYYKSKQIKLEKERIEREFESNDD